MPTPFQQSYAVGMATLLITLAAGHYWLGGHDTILLTSDSISTGSGTAVGLAIASMTVSAFIITLIRYAQEYRNHRGWSPVTFSSAARHALAVAVRNSLALFAISVSAGVLWQKVVGHAEITAAAATILVAALTAAITAYLSVAVRGAYSGYVSRHIGARPAW